MVRVGGRARGGETAWSIQILLDADTRQILGGMILGIEGSQPSRFDSR